MQTLSQAVALLLGGRKDANRPSKDCRPPQPQSNSKIPNLPTSAGYDDDRPIVLESAGWEILPDGTQQLLVDCGTLVEFVCLPGDLKFSRNVLFKVEWDSERKLAYYRKREVQPGRINDQVATQKPDVRAPAQRNLESQMEPDLGKLRYPGVQNEHSLNEPDRVGELQRDLPSASEDKAVRPRDEQPGRSETPLKSKLGNAGFPEK